MGYIFLAVAIVAEVAATTALKASEEFTRLWPSLFVVVSYSISFYFLSLVLKTIPVGIAYAIWAGMGIVLIAALAAVVYRQVPDLPAVIGMLMIVGGVVVINLFSDTVSH